MTNTERIEGLTPYVIAGYCEALLWANAVDSDGQSVEGAHQGFAPVSLSDFNESARESIRGDVTAFVTSNAEDFLSYVDTRVTAGIGGPRTAAECFGHDFLLTRSGHGAGFWDRGLGELGDRLTSNAKPYGETIAVVDEDTAPGEIGLM